MQELKSQKLFSLYFSFIDLANVLITKQQLGINIAMYSFYFMANLANIL